MEVRRTVTYGSTWDRSSINHNKASINAQGLPEPSSLRGSTSVPEQLNIKTVTEACKLIDGCSLELCSATLFRGISWHMPQK